MATKSSYMLAVLLIANPFMLLFFQNCTPNTPSDRAVASTAPIEKPQIEFSSTIDKNLKIK